MTNSTLSALPPEAQLLFRLISAAPGDPEVRALLAGPIDWQRLALLAHREQAYTVLPARLKSYGDAVPAEQAAAFARLAIVAEFHLAHLQTRLEQSVATLAEAGIEVVLLKGAGLAYTAYRSFLERPMSDVDLLVRPAQALEAQRLLGTIGWTWDGGTDAAAFYAHHHHLPPMHDPRAGGANLELHTALFISGHPLLLTSEAIWSAAREVSPRGARGARVLVPHPHHQLLHACLHFAWGHMMHSGAWRTFRDVDALVATGEIDWDAFVQLAQASRGASCCYWTFDLARALGGVSTVPDEVLVRLRPPLSRLVRERLRRHLGLTAVGAPTNSPSVKIDRFVWEAAIMPHHHGHGPVRPWAQEERLRERGDRAEPESAGGGSRIAAGLQKAGEYGRYLRTMLTR
jgi:hypothetical protein